MLPTNTFALLVVTTNRRIVDHKSSVVWLVGDDSNLDWSCMVPPLKCCQTRTEKRGSKWLEGGMQEEVLECTFGILGGGSESSGVASG